jgi:hypothetical protein
MFKKDELVKFKDKEGNWIKGTVWETRDKFALVRTKDEPNPKPFKNWWALVPFRDLFYQADMSPTQEEIDNAFGEC